MTGFQKQVNSQQAPATEGDFASANPRASVLAGEGALVAGVGGVNVGKFAWLQADGNTVLPYGTAPAAPNGFCARTQQAQLQTYLQEAGVNIPAGSPVTLFNSGDFWAKLTGANAAAIGDAIYATYADGSITAGAAATGASVTGSIGATMTAAIGSTFTATGTGTSLAVTAITGYLSVGDTISGTGVPAGTTIVAQVSGTAGSNGTYTTSTATTASAATVTSFGTVINVTAITGYLSVGDTLSTGGVVTAQLSGTAGSTGRYSFSVPATAYTASGTVTAYGTVLNVTAVSSGTLAIGDPVSGSGVPSNAVISSFIGGTYGGVGLYRLSKAATAYAASTTVTATAGVLTSFKAMSIAAVGELVKISTRS